MSDDIKELVKRLRDERIQHSVMGPVSMRDAADALEALVAERDRLKAALEAIVKAEYSGGAKTAIARKALEAKE